MLRVEEAVELGHVGLAENDRARGLQLRDQRGVGARHRLLQRDRAARGGQAGASIVSSSSTGMPCSGPRAPLVARSRSSVAASATARVFSERTACSAGPSALVSAIRVRYALASVSDVSVPAVRRSCSDFSRLRLERERQDRLRRPPASAPTRSPGCRRRASANGGAGSVFAQRYMLGFSADAGWRFFVPCSITYATPSRSRSL